MEGGKEEKEERKERRDYPSAITPVDYIWRYFLCKPVVLS